MKDLDFDELDRAVNSLITSTPSQSSPSDNNLQKPDSVDLAEKTNDSKDIAPTASSLAGRRSTGRFMDVVHPSSDMRTTLAAPERVSRQGATINPVSATPVVPDTPPVVTPMVAAPKSSWPDPIDFHEFKSSQVVNNPEPEKNEDDDIDKINDDITNTLNQASGDTPDSPFIPGTKVDKRPLGAFSSESPVPASEPPAEETKTDKTTDLSDEASNVITPLPAELQNDLLSIESDSSTNPEAVSDMPVVEAEIPAVVTTAPTPVVVPATAPVKAPAADNQPSGPTSITQQYKEQPNSGDQKTGAIYDTDAYHKALLHPAKKKSGWMWVLWIVILLVVGAGAGYVVYSFVLPNL